MACVWSGVSSATMNFGPPEPEGVRRIVALECCKQHSLCTETPHTEVPGCVTGVHRKTFGKRCKPKIWPSTAIVKKEKKSQEIVKERQKPRNTCTSNNYFHPHWLKELLLSFFFFYFDVAVSAII